MAREEMMLKEGLLVRENLLAKEGIGRRRVLERKGRKKRVLERKGGKGAEKRGRKKGGKGWKENLELMKAEVH